MWKSIEKAIQDQLNIPFNILSSTPLAGGDINESVCQPSWSSDGILYFISDKNNWWNLYRLGENGIECIIKLDAQFAVPQWSFRESNYDFIDYNSIIVERKYSYFLR